MSKYLLVETGEGDQGGTELFTVLGGLEEPTKEAIRDKIRGNEGLQDLGYDKNLTLKEEDTWHMPNLFGINKCVASYTINDDVFFRELVVLELK